MISDFIEAAQDNFLLLDGEYHSKLEEITTELRNNYDSIHRTGWKLRDTSVLFSIFNSMDTSVNIVNFTPVQIELTKRLFPKKSQKEIIQQKYRLKTKKALEEKRGSIIRTWLQDKNELEAKTHLAWQDVNKKRLAEIEKRVSLSSQADLCQFWSERLEKMRNEKCVNVKRLRISIEPVQKFRENQCKSIVENEKARRKEVSAEIQKYEAKQLVDKMNPYEQTDLVTQMMQDIMKVKSSANM